MRILPWRYEPSAAEVPELMKSLKIPEVAVALVDREGMMRGAGFGFTDFGHDTPVMRDASADAEIFVEPSDDASAAPKKSRQGAEVCHTERTYDVQERTAVSRTSASEMYPPRDGLNESPTPAYHCPGPMHVSPCLRRFAVFYSRLQHQNCDDKQQTVDGISNNEPEEPLLHDIRQV